jgi:SWI/SNF-related matrix-associated actin-dependent regulator of chromatin subfamily A member 5
MLPLGGDLPTCSFRAQAANITDQDIDAIIQKGVNATKELNEKMKQYTENAKAFTLDGGFNAYEYKDEDDIPDELPNYKQLAGNPACSISFCHLTSAVTLVEAVLQDGAIKRFVLGGAGSNWVDPPKRERKRVVNYAENEYFRQAMKSGTGPRASGLRLPKMPQLQARSCARHV